MPIDLSEVMGTVNQLKMMRSSLDGRLEQLKSQLNTQLKPEFEKLGVSTDNIEEVIRVEEEELKNAYAKLQATISEVNSNLGK
jgi:hypothetical protein